MDDYKQMVDAYKQAEVLVKQGAPYIYCESYFHGKEGE